MKQWKKYVGYNQWDKNFAGQDSAAPGAVNNSSLFQGYDSQSHHYDLQDWSSSVLNQLVFILGSRYSHPMFQIS